VSDSQNYRETCHCSHDKATHFEGKYNCLGVHCNDCKSYRNEWGPVKPPEDSIIPPPPETEPTVDDDDHDYGDP
jgi:hypothetical protein